MSELNYINETVVPRMPKSVSDEQLFVFVPVGNDTVAGIFKINTRDFDVASLPVLTINQDDTVTENGIGFVRGGAVYTFVKSEVEYLNNIKQNKNLSEPIAGETTVEGALTNLAGRMNTAEGNVTNLKGRMFTAEGNINTLKTTVGDATSGLVKQVNDNSSAIIANKKDTDDAIGALDKRVTANSNSITTLDGKVTGLSSGQEALKTRMTAAENKLNVHAQDIAGLKAEDANLRKDINTNSSHIAIQETAVEKNTNDIKALQDAAYGGETPIGSYDSGPTLPSQDDLTNFVITHTTPSRAPKLGDVVLFTQIVTGGTDKSYKFMYTASEPEHWVNYVIPTVESATNTDKGILQGTLNDTSGNIQVSIIAGKVADILVKDGSTYKSIKTVLDNLATSIANTNSTVAANKAAADQGIAEAKAAAAAVIKKYNNVEFTLVSSTDTTMDKFPCKYTANIEGVTINNVADVYFSALQIPLEIFSSYVQVEDGKVSIFATVKTNYPTSVTVPTVRIS